MNERLTSKLGAAHVVPSDATRSHDLNFRRIARALADRKRYKYVTPRVVAVNGGYRIESPCCSRNIDTEGGVIDVALILSGAEPGWQLYRKDHAQGQWLLDSAHTALPALLERLNCDPERIFWQ